METADTKSVETFGLARAPIVEAVIDIDCDLPPAMVFAALEKPARERLRDKYPKFRAQLVQEHQIEQLGQAEPKFTVRKGIQAFQFRSEDERQLVQIRPLGFSFNRLSPYSSLDDYLTEIERTWKLFVEVAAPIQVRKIGLRYINRILLPIHEGQLELRDYLNVCPQLPEKERLKFVGFLNHHAALEVATDNRVNIVLTMQNPETDRLPLIFDIETFHAEASNPGDWDHLLSRIVSLRSLKNRIFKNTLTDKCLNLFQQ
ncbi:MAG: TIGR04255 family protein [Verrucomicrobiales bacterium]|nr:TIGR04255 family protein [Verrucomicrobiales bacterium]